MISPCGLARSLRLFSASSIVEKRRIELVICGRDHRPGAAATHVGQLAELAHEPVDVAQRIGADSFFDREDAAVDADAAKKQVEHLLGELDLSEAQIVEHILELVRERAHACSAEKSGQPLQRMDGAKDIVDQFGLGGALPPSVVELEQIPRQTLDDLVRLGEEFLPRLVAHVGHGVIRSPPGRSRSDGSPPKPARRRSKVWPGIRRPRGTGPACDLFPTIA